MLTSGHFLNQMHLLSCLFNDNKLAGDLSSSFWNSYNVTGPWYGLYINGVRKAPFRRTLIDDKCHSPLKEFPEPPA